jgi:hypothetical protein
VRDPIFGTSGVWCDTSPYVLNFWSTARYGIVRAAVIEMCVPTHFLADEIAHHWGAIVV